MDTFVSKKRVILNIIFIFTVAFFINTFVMYENIKKDIEYTQSNLKTNISNLYDEVLGSMLKKQMNMRSDIMLTKYNSQAKLIAIKNKDRKELIKLFDTHFESLKENMAGFNIMHIYDKDGISILRMHNIDKFGDDLKTFRPIVSSLVENPRCYSFFEYGIQGLAYRVTKPVYLENELIGFFEIGVKPVVLIEKAKKVFGLNSYFFMKENFADKVIEKEELLKKDGYTLCNYCAKEDKFIKDNISKFTFSKEDNKVFSYQDKYYSVITEKIEDGHSKCIGYMVLFQDVTTFHNQIKNLIIKSVIIYLIVLLLISIMLYKYIGTIFKKLNKARYLLDNTNDAVYVFNLKDASIADINKRCSLMLGYSRDELLDKTVFDIRKPMPGSKPLEWKHHLKDLKEKKFITSRGMHLRKDGTKFPVEASLSYIVDDGVEYMIAVVRDITKQLDIETKNRKKTLELERLQNVISKAVLYTTSDLDGKITSVSKAFEEFSGFKESELIGKNHSLFKSGDTSKEFYEKMWDTLSNDEKFVGEIKNYDKNRNPYWINIIIDPLFDENGKKVGYTSYREDITDKKELEYLSSHDTLTGIYNRACFKEEIHKKIKSAKRYGHRFGLIMFDIDHFKNVNDTYGHYTGDEVLKNIAESINTSLREDDIFARWGGEEFIIIANEVDVDQLKTLTQKLQKEIHNVSFAPVPKVTVSFGLTVYQDGDNEESIQKRADKALYRAKENGRDRYESV